MIRKTLILVLLTGLWAVAGCAGTPTGPNPVAVAPGAVTVVPYDISARGLYQVQVSLNGEGPFDFIVDTGATISCLFESTARQLSVPIDTGETTTVHGIVASAVQPVSSLPRIDVGDITRTDLKVAILEDRKDGNVAAGILGMDVMQNYALVFDSEINTITFYRPDLFDESLFRSWRLMPLQKNPYSNDDFGLYFLNLKLSGYSVPAVFDLGSSLSIVNWDAAQNPELRRYRRRLRQNWEMEGAVGLFEPTILVRFETVRGTTYSWEGWNVYVTDMETLNIIGTEGRPLMIAGADMFRDTSFAVDFSTESLFIKSTPAHKKGRDRDRPKTGTRTDAKTGAIGVFDGIER